MRMRRFVVDAPLQGHYEEADAPEVVNADDVRVRITAAGVCGTDLHIWHGLRPQPLPFVIGHEYVGIVESVGSAVTKVQVGDYVTGEANYTCGKCQMCVTGHGNLCEHRLGLGQQVPGVFQEYTVAPERFIWKLPANVSKAAGGGMEAGLVGYHAVHMAKVGDMDRVLIYGAGCLGLWALQCAKVCGGIVTMADLNKERLALAKELGADHVVCTAEEELPEKSFEKVIDCAGVVATNQDTVRVCADNGDIVFVGQSPKPVSFNMRDIVRRELHLHGSLASNGEYPAFIRMLEKGIISGDKIGNGIFPFEQIPEALEAMHKQTAIKPIIDFTL